MCLLTRIIRPDAPSFSDRLNRNQYCRPIAALQICGDQARSRSISDYQRPVRPALLLGAPSIRWREDRAPRQRHAGGSLLPATTGRHTPTQARRRDLAPTRHIMPKRHQAQQQWSPGRLKRWAGDRRFRTPAPWVGRPVRPAGAPGAGLPCLPGPAEPLQAIPGHPAQCRLPHRQPGRTRPWVDGNQLLRPVHPHRRFRGS